MLEILHPAVLVTNGNLDQASLRSDLWMKKGNNKWTLFSHHLHLLLLANSLFSFF